MCQVPVFTRGQLHLPDQSGHFGAKNRLIRFQIRLAFFEKKENAISEVVQRRVVLDSLASVSISTGIWA